ncbi:endo-1,4-beta-xylanase [uncultured Polaribacter sp.]|uniref:endo-1,4-beta-xylanase n=1 Tax=uncultured Polaribacter sp. TaxID=174711 RepID=UPI0026161C81|nr:endo-1,4-beta-xylanase [uncultured Polaribacter sp.]
MKKYRTIYLLITLMFTLGFNSCEKEDAEIEFDTIPVANEALDIRPTEFRISWQPIFRSSGYQLDVSLDETFSTFVSGYNSKSINGFQEIITDLSNNTRYFYRVRGLLNGVPTENSNVVSVVTRFIPDEVITLKSSASNFFVGVAVNPDRIADSQYMEVYEREFNSVTAENAMKMANIITGIDAMMNISYDWSKADAIVDYAEEKGMNIHGHALIWHESVPNALTNFTGTDAQFEAIVEDYITTTVTRYKDKVDSWDVVNEAIIDNSTSLRASIFRQKMGENYLEKCFQFARNADPNVKLFYNDYNMVTDPLKRSGALREIDKLIASNLLDGVGYQMHINIENPSEAEMQTATNELVSRNVLIHYSELDVRTNLNGQSTTFTEQRSFAQSDKVREVTRVYNSIPDANKYALTLWGLKDDDSWITPRFNVLDWPLLFDNEFGKKEAYSGFIEGLQ